jgi:hypothetical protein
MGGICGKSVVEALVNLRQGYTAPRMLGFVEFGLLVLGTLFVRSLMESTIVMVLILHSLSACACEVMFFEPSSLFPSLLPGSPLFSPLSPFLSFPFSPFSKHSRLLLTSPLFTLT